MYVCIGGNNNHQMQKGDVCGTDLGLRISAINFRIPKHLSAT